MMNRLVYASGLFFVLVFIAAPVLAQEAAYPSSSLRPEFSAPIADYNKLSWISDWNPISMVQTISNGFLNAFSEAGTSFLRFPKEWVKRVPEDNPARAEEKLKGNLRDSLMRNSSEEVLVNVIVFPDYLNDAAQHVQSKGALVENSFLVGNILSIRVPRDKLLAVAQISEVKSIWPDRVFHANLDSSVPQIHASDMWNAGYTGVGIKVAVLDTGIDGTHPMLVGRVPVSQSFTGEPVADITGHGTHVAGIVGGKLNGPNTFNGVAPDVQLWNMKVLDNTGRGSESWIISGINYAVDPDNNPSTNDGVDVLNLSFGGPYTDPNSPIVATIEGAISRGVVVVIASGNCGTGCPSPDCQGFIGVETPGDAPNAITVGAVDDASQWACFSSGGFVNNGQTLKPDVVAPGVNISSSSLNGTLATLSGTSMAAPHVSGMVALLLQSNPSISPLNVKDILEQTASDFGDVGKDAKYGSGLIDGSQLLPSSVLLLLKYSLFQSSNVIDTGNPISFTISSASNDVYSIELKVTHPNQLVDIVPLTQNGLQWAGNFSSTQLSGTYLVTATIENLAHDITILHKSFVVKSPSTTGVLLAHDLPAQANYGQPVSVNVQFQNTGNYPTEVLVELQEWKGDYFEHIRFSDATPVSAGQTVFIPLSWTPRSSIGTKTIKLVATFDDASSEMDQNVLVLDADAPVIWSVQNPSAVSQFQPVKVKVRAGDLTSLSGVLHVTLPSSAVVNVPLLQNPVYDFNQSLNVLIETPEAGTYFYTAEVCDGASSPHCTTSAPQSFAVSVCALPRALVILGDENADSFSPLSSNYCLGFWTIPTQTPTSSFLNLFPLVYWDAGTSYVNAIDENASIVLQNYSGNIVLEGEDIALRHGSDALMKNVAHADFNAGYSIDINSPVNLSIEYPHLSLQNIPSPLPFDLGNIRMNPSGVAPDANAISLAAWDANGSGIVAWQNGNQKHLFVGFSSRFLGPSVQQSLRSSIFNWMFLNSGPDVIVSEYTPSFDPSRPRFPPFFPKGSSPSLLISPIPYTQYFIPGPNTLSFSMKNTGSQAALSFPVDVRVDGTTHFRKIISLNPNEALQVVASANFSPGYHTIEIIPDPDAFLAEPNALNNRVAIPVWVAPNLPNVRSLEIGSHYQNGIMTVRFRVANFGSIPVSNIAFRTIVDNNVSPLFASLNPGEIKVLERQVAMPRKNFVVSINADPLNSILESDETDNYLNQTQYFCTKQNVLVVNDDDAQAYWSSDEDFSGDIQDLNASSAPLFEQLLKENGYCTTVWNESAQGVPAANVLNQYPLVIWTTGDYWSKVIDANDEAAIRQYSGNILFEGNDVAFDHADDNFSYDVLRADMNHDVFSLSGSERIFLNQSIFPSLSHLDLNLLYSSFPDAVTSVNGGISAGDWNAGKSAMIFFSGPASRTAFMGFSLDSISRPADQNAFLARTVEWLLQASNQSPSAPANLSCNNSLCAGNYSNSLSLACAGSVDPENDSITYSLEANLSSSPTPPSGWWDAAWQNRQPLTIANSGNTLSDFTIRLDINAQTSDSSFWNTVNSTGADIRFMDGNQPLPFFIESFDSVSQKAIIHVRTSSLPTGNAPLFIYWNNPTAPPQSNFDSISRITIHDGTSLAGWSQSTYGGNDWVVQSGNFYNNSVTGTQYLAKSATGQYEKSQVVWFKTRMRSDASSDMEMRFYPYSDFPNYPDDVIIQLRPGFLDVWMDDAPSTFCGSSPTTPSTFHDILGSRGTDNVWRIYNDGIKVLECSDAAVKTTPFYSMHSHAGNVSGYVDYSYHRLTTAQEPSSAFGAIQSSSSPGSAAWQEIGTHPANSSYAWNIFPLGTQSNVGLRCRALDAGGSGRYSPYYAADQNISIN